MKPNERKPRIGIFGRRNVGKSTLINCLTNRDTSIVSDTPGTTTDPVLKTMELGGVGPVVLIDTAGIDDVGELGLQRAERSKSVLGEVDLALLLYTDWGNPEESLEECCTRYDTPLIRIRSKADLRSGSTEAEEGLPFSAFSAESVQRISEAIASRLPENSYRSANIMEGLVGERECVLLVTPIDQSAPEGRMILPQVQVLRALMDIHAEALFCQPEEVADALGKLSQKPSLIITDSQAFREVAQAAPKDVPLTSFSLLLAHQKGPFEAYLKGTEAIGRLKDKDRVLMLESCTHNITCEDIGRTKLPAALRRKTGKELLFETAAGEISPERAARMKDYALVVQCGGCNITRKQLTARLRPAMEAGVAVSNYGLALSWCAGIFDRATEIFKGGSTNTQL